MEIRHKESLWECHCSGNKMIAANLSRWRGKLSSQGCPAGRQVLRAEQRQGRGGDQHYNFYNFCFSSPLFSLCACRSVITPAAWNPLCHLCFISLSSPKVLLRFPSPPSPLFPEKCCTCQVTTPFIAVWLEYDIFGECSQLTPCIQYFGSQKPK